MTAASLAPDSAGLLQRAMQLHGMGQLDEAEALYRAVLAGMPNHFDALHGLGVIAAQRRSYAEADALLQRAVAVNPRSSDALANRANVQNALGRYADSLVSTEQALRVAPHHFGALYNRGAALLDLQRYADALACLDQTLAIRGHHVEALYNRGLALQRMGNPVEAIRSYDRALAVRADFPEALNNRGLNLQCLHRYGEARDDYSEALALRPDFAEALYNRGSALSAMGRYAEAIRDLEHALALFPDLPYAAGALLHARMHACDWAAFERDTESLLTDVRAGKRCAEPLTILNISNSPRDQFTCARTYVDDRWPAARISLWKGERYAHDRIRIAYLSSDFHDHAVMHLIAGLFEHHDRRRFDVAGVSFGPDPPTPMRARLKRSFERFIDARDQTDSEVASQLRALEIDIAVDLNGFTDNARTGIFALRSAPTQVNYLGYPGTMGASYFDYIIVDRTIVPHEQQDAYAEKIVYLPDCYQINDDTRLIASHTPTRRDVGLPEAGFVFCSFNNNFKITPAVFSVWMRLLREIDGSVLWLYEGNRDAPPNLRRQAERRGVAPERLVFAPKVPTGEHLARHRLADLFLDTQPWNAHTTASDALWAGLPVLTCKGATFAGSVAASLLRAIGLDELVTQSLSEYEALALALARDPVLLAGVKQKLGRNRGIYPLFDTDRGRRAIEAAYIEMCARQRRGEPPASFAVAPIA